MRDASGEKYNRLTLVSFDHKDSRGKPYYLCRCECGNTIIARLDCIKSGNTKSCGCFHAESAGHRLSDALRKHNGTGTRLYKIFKGMHYRCNAKGRRAGKQYADRGIKVCEEWSDFAVFREWALAAGYDDTKTIDRVNVDGDYEPGNCRWATRAQQAANKTNTLTIKLHGETIRLKDACKAAGIPYIRAYQQLTRQHMNPEDVFNTV